MIKFPNKRRLWQALLCLLLTAAMTLAGAAAEVDLEADLDAAVVGMPDPELELAAVSDEAILLELNAIEGDQALESDPAESPAAPADRTVSAPEDFEIDENGVLAKYKGAGGDVVIPAGVTGIGTWAFYDCSALTGVTIPASVTSIEAYAFGACTGLRSVTIPAGVTSIGMAAFLGCSGLKSATLPAGLTSLGNSAFSGCSSLTDVTIPQGVSVIEDDAFFECGSLRSVTIQEGVTGIGHAVFFKCGSLKRVTIPKSVTSIGYNVFYGCDSLTIYGKAGSYAETYAKKEGIPFSTSAVTPKPDSVSITQGKAATLCAGQTLQLKAKLTPASASTTLKWTTSNKKVATVTGKGLVRALKKGTATITVRTANGKKAAIKITVPTAPTKVKFARKSYSVKVGKTATLKTSLTPSSAKTVLTFSTSNKKVATVTSKGVVKGIKKGTATITVKTANGKKATVKVTVK